MKERDAPSKRKVMVVERGVRGTGGNLLNVAISRRLLCWDVRHREKTKKTGGGEGEEKRIFPQAWDKKKKKIT